jgi:hypothetical protein
VGSIVTARAARLAPQPSSETEPVASQPATDAEAAPLNHSLRRMARSVARSARGWKRGYPQTVTGATSALRPAHGAC